MAFERVGKEERSSKSKRCHTIEDKKDFVNFALQSVKHATAHRSRMEDKQKPTTDSKETRVVGLLDISICIREEGIRFNCVRTAMWPKK